MKDEIFNGNANSRDDVFPPAHPNQYEYPELLDDNGSTSSQMYPSSANKPASQGANIHRHMGMPGNKINS